MAATDSAPRRERVNARLRAPAATRSARSSATSAVAVRRGASVRSTTSCSPVPSGPDGRPASGVSGARAACATTETWAATTPGAAATPCTTTPCAATATGTGAGTTETCAQGSSSGSSADHGASDPGSSGGSHSTTVLVPAGDASSVIARTSSGPTPINRAALAAGSAVVADAMTKVGYAPYAAATRRSRRSTSPTCAPNTPRNAWHSSSTTYCSEESRRDHRWCCGSRVTCSRSGLVSTTSAYSRTQRRSSREVSPSHVATRTSRSSAAFSSRSSPASWSAASALVGHR